MATTLTALATDGTKVVLGHVGDSRGYLFRAGGLQQITTDHTYVQQLVASGQLDPAAVRRHPWRNVVLRSLHGGPLEVDQAPDVVVLDLVPGDRLLLCSDGLTDLVDDAASSPRSCGWTTRVPRRRSWSRRRWTPAAPTT